MISHRSNYFPWPAEHSQGLDCALALSAYTYIPADSTSGPQSLDVTFWHDPGTGKNAQAAG